MKKILITFIVGVLSIAGVYADNQVFNNPVGTDLIGADLTGLDSSLRISHGGETTAIVCDYLAPGSTYVSHTVGTNPGTEVLRWDNVSAFYEFTSSLAISSVTCDVPVITDYHINSADVTAIGGGATDVANSLIGSLADLLPVLVPLLIVGFIIGVVVSIFRNR